MSSDNLAYGIYLYGEEPYESLISKKLHGGGYTALFMTKLFSSYFSDVFDIHYADFIGSYLGIIKGFFASIMLFILIKYSFVYKKSLSLFILIFIFLSLWSYAVVLKYFAEWIFFSNNTYFRYIFPLIFYFILFSSVYKMILNRKHIKKSKFLNIFLLLCCVFIATNLETVAITSVLFPLIICVYNFSVKFIINKFSIKTQNKLTFYFTSYTHFLFLFLIISFILYVFSPGVMDLCRSRVYFEFNYTNSIYNWIHWYFINNKIYHILIITALIISSFIAFKRKEINKVIYPFFMYITLFVSMLSLLFSQKEGTFFIQDGRIQYILKVLLLFIIFILLSYILKHIKYSKLYTTFISICFLFASGYMIKYLSSNYSYLLNKANMYALEKTKNYIQGKMFRYYELKNIQPVLDITNLDDNTESSLLWRPFSNEKCEITEINFYLYSYYIHEYKKKPYKMVCYSINAIPLFYENGGYFTKEELNNIEFDNLLDDDFVLHTKGNKIQPDRIFELMNKQIEK